MGAREDLSFQRRGQHASIGEKEFR